MLAAPAENEPAANGPLRLAVIVGSVREGRGGTAVADWFAGRARDFDQFDVTVIDLAHYELPLSFGSDGSAARRPGLRPLSEVLSESDAFVVVTPEYNHSYPAGLKNAIDWHLREWQAKPVAFVSYGGISGGLRAVEHLRPVFAEVHAVTIRESISFVNYWEQFDDEGHWPRESATGDTAAKTLLKQLAWWARVLRDARAEQPYPG